MAKKVQVAAPEMKTYLLEIATPRYGQAARKKVTVPASWKITYGPAAQGAHLGGDNPFVLRFYEGAKENMRALFHGVLSFRDVSIKVEEEVEKVQAETLHKDTPHGRKDVVVEGRIKEWRDADSPTAGAVEDQAFLNMAPQLPQAMFLHPAVPMPPQGPIGYPPPRP